MQPINLSALTDTDLDSLSRTIAKDVDDYSVQKYSDGPRRHLGGSEIGNECERYLWLKFRWTFNKQFTGRMLRLFQTGHREEDRFIEYLRGIGFTVWAHEKLPTWAPDANGQPVMVDKGKQFQIEACDGHFGGSLDGILQWPARYNIEGYGLGEFKTKATGSGFNNLSTNGVKKEAPIHYAQMCVYGSDPKYQLTHGLYQVKNKNDDDISYQVVKLDWALGAALRVKAERIITAKSPPVRISNNPTHFKCKMCDAKDNCHKDKPSDINCRSCVHSEPRANKTWFCTLNQGTIPDTLIPVGCTDYDDINTGQ